MTDRAQRIREILWTVHDAFARRDLPAIGKHFAADVRFVSPGGAPHGRQARLDDEQRIFDAFTDLALTVTTAVVEGNEAVEFCILSGRHTGPLVTQAGILPPTGRNISLRFAAHYTFAGDEIAAQEIVYDQATILKQLGS